jgi:hypothetical protein
MGMFLAVPIMGIVAAIWRSLIAVMSDREHAMALVGGADPPSPPPEPDPPDPSPPEPIPDPRPA